MANTDFENRLEASLKKSQAAFDGAYKDSLNDLLGLSDDELKGILPDTTDLEVYHKLIVVVQEASASNESQATLKANVLKLGDTAVTIAKKSASLAALLGL